MKKMSFEPPGGECNRRGARLFSLATIIYLFYLALGGVDRDLALWDSLGAAAKARWSVTVW